MAEGWTRTQLTGALRDAGLKDDEQHFIHALIRYASQGQLLARSAVGVPTASLTVPWAVSLLTAHQVNRLHARHARNALESAIQACARLSSQWNHLPTLRAWHETLTGALAHPALSQAPTMTVGPRDLDRYRSEVVTLALAPSAVRPDPLVLDMLAAELAIGLVARNVDIDRFILAIRNLDKQQPMYRTALGQLLRLPEQTFHVLVAVTGAKTFDSVESLDPSLKMRQVLVGQPGAFPGWGVAGHYGRRFVDVVTRKPIRKPGELRLPWRRPTVLTMDVRAHDGRAAVTAARRRVAEVLDQYVAGHPWARFEILDAFCVAAHGENHAQFLVLNPPPADSVTPLAVPWPSTLRQAMRVSHLVREATAPMTRVALAWVTIEAAGVQPKSVHLEALAHALALLLLRQSVFLPYRLVMQDALDREQGRVYERRRKAIRLLAGKRRALAMQPGIPPAVVPQKQYSALRLELLSNLYALLRDKYQDDALQRRTSLATLNASVNPAPKGRAQYNTYLRTMAPWAALLVSEWETSPSPDASALRKLLEPASLLTQAEIRRISDVLRSPTSTADLLCTYADWMVHVLRALYAARNLNLHSGLFETDGDIALAHLAVLLIDTLFETWGTWYEPAPSSPLEATQVLTRLGARFDQCVGHLRNGGSAIDLDLDNLTRPRWSPNRV
jgi:hypothetical protein